MSFHKLRWLFLVALVLVQAGCASTSESTNDNPPPLEPVPSNSDSSHGWGANVGNVN